MISFFKTGAQGRALLRSSSPFELMIVHLCTSPFSEGRVVSNVSKGDPLLSEKGALQLQGAGHQLLGEAVILTVGYSTSRTVLNLWWTYVLTLQVILICFTFLCALLPLRKISTGAEMLCYDFGGASKMRSLWHLSKAMLSSVCSDS